MSELERTVTKVIVPSGMLGAGVKREHIAYGLAQGAHAIAVDAGSTDSGPSYLARGVSKMNRESIKQDLLILLQMANEAGIPVLVGTCGTCGADSSVDWTRDIAIEAARELGIGLRIACLYSEQPAAVLKRKLAQGKIRPLAPLEQATDELFDACDHIVALMGPEPYIDAVKRGANLVLGGRTTDTAVLSAVPLMRGAGVAQTWHAAKIAECGGQCTTNLRRGGVLMHVGTDQFDMEPLDPGNRCTPESVSAHLLYENSDPFLLVEPGGVLDATEAVYTQVEPRITRVVGSIWRPMPYTMKLEGARGGDYQTIMLIGIEDPEVLANLDEFHDRMHKTLVERIAATFGDEAGDFEVSLRLYGWNGTSGRPVPADTPPPRDVGVLFVVTARTQDLADRMARSCNPYFFHMPIRFDMELPSYAFPFTPAEIPRGRVYEFMLNHVVETEDGFELVRTEWVDVSSTGTVEHLETPNAQDR
ncbi:acyclic terpene utilization AtuA family protein [Nitrospirillum sp. BR 11164]|uniref:acyclic terpene utilization AtuA family protein n=1 Tax=Nitrospirillum sp. BR 11164 TaxID=3104324 RepID=UPI002AFDE15F|nr:acyclic terpene utilization AtuA family protein [Nitrospirillum sp. BR 11164]MEA1652184.1 acyclic terpene utilization AtuA family protein [Nitrospirillum sp. BR 11164]